jgi:AraC-like DNA-binding protein
MHMEYFTTIFRCTTFAIALFLIIYLVYFKARTQTAIFLLLFLATFVGSAFHQIIAHSYLSAKYPALFYLPVNFFSFSAPFFYLYVVSLFRKVTKKEIFFFALPGFCEFIFMFVMFCLPADISAGITKNSSFISPILVSVVLPIFSLSLIVLIFIRIRRFYHKCSGSFFVNKQQKLKLIGYLCAVIAVNYIFMASAFFLQDVWAELVDSLFKMFCIYMLSIYCIREIHISTELSPVSQINKINYSDGESFNKILKILDDNKVFTNPNLTVDELADLVNLHPKKVSQLINHYGGTNFNQLVNAYRVEESKRLLVDPKYSNITMHGIAKEAGFNSRSVFNQVFKVQVGQTPSDFRKNLPE